MSKSISSTVYSLLSSIFLTKSDKGELNDDGIIDYNDVTLLEEHLIHKKDLPEDKISNADMNSDGKITVTDLKFHKH